MRLQLVLDIGSSRVMVQGHQVDGTGAVIGTVDGAQVVTPASVWIGDDGEVRLGDAAVEASWAAPSQLVVGWSDRLGDPVPFHTAAGPLSGAELMQLAIAEPVAEVLRRLGGAGGEGGGVPADEVLATVLLADDWPALRVRQVEAAVADVLRPLVDKTDVRAVRRGRLVPEVVAEPPARAAQDPHAQAAQLVLDIGAAAVRADVVDPEQGVVRSSTRTGIGGDVLDDRVFRHLLAQVPDTLRADPGSPEATAELMQMRAAGRQAREDLSTSTEAVVRVRLARASSDLRLVRPELEALLEEDFNAILEVGQRAVDAWNGALTSVVLIGGCARTPRLVQLASARWAVPVDRPEAPEQALSAAALHRLATEAAAGQGAGGTVPPASPPAPALVAAPVGLPAALPGESSPESGWPFWTEGGHDDEHADFRDVEGGEHLVGIRPRRVRPFLVGAALAAVLASGVGVALAAILDGEPDATAAGSGPGDGRSQASFELGVPWAPEVFALTGGEDPAERTNQRVLPGAPVAPLTSPAQDVGLAAPGVAGSGLAPDSDAARPGGRTGVGKTPSRSAAKPAAPGGSTSSTTPEQTVPGPTTDGTAKPEPTTPGTTDPGPTTPGPTDPGPTDPGPTDPGPTDPGPTDPGPTDPGPTDPGPTDPGPTDPGPTGPGTTEPEPTGTGSTSPDPTVPVEPSTPATDPGPSSTDDTGATP